MADQATIDNLTARIAAIDAKLDSGKTQVEVDGIKQTVSLSQLRIQRTELQRELDECLAEDSGDSTEQSPFRRMQL